MFSSYSNAKINSFNNKLINYASLIIHIGLHVIFLINTRHISNKYTSFFLFILAIFFNKYTRHILKIQHHILNKQSSYT